MEMCSLPWYMFTGSPSLLGFGRVFTSSLIIQLLREDSNGYSIVGPGGVIAAYLGILELTWVRKAVNLQQEQASTCSSHSYGRFCSCLFIAICTQASEIKTRSCLSVCLQLHPYVSNVSIPEVCFLLPSESSLFSFPTPLREGRVNVNLE